MKRKAEKPKVDRGGSAEGVGLAPQNAASSDTLDSLVLFAVATTMTKAIPQGTNIQTVLVSLSARSREEAIGIAYEDATARLPEHQIFTTVCIEIKQNAGGHVST